jgi:hypothetical protein
VKRRQTGIALRFVFAAATLIFAAVGCKDSNTITEPPHVTVPTTPTPSISTPTPTPTPPPASGIAGSWTGTWDSWSPTSTCQGVPAAASFSVVGRDVTGAVGSSGKIHSLSSCGLFGLNVQGSFSGGHLSGIATSGEGGDGLGRVNGVLSRSGTSLELTFHDLNRFGHAYPGSVHLHR